MPISLGQIRFPQQNQIDYVTALQGFELSPNDVLLQTCYSVVSPGTETAKLTGVQATDYPYIPGNRASGRVLDIGDAVTNLQPGDWIFSHTPHVSHALANRLRLPIPDGIDRRHSPLVGMALVAMTALCVGNIELGDRVVVIGLGLVGNLTAQIMKLAGRQVTGLDLISNHVFKPSRAVEAYATLRDQPEKTMAAIFDWTEENN